ncbi:MAG: hypothetical protein QN120_01335 [Armatimonadota bacterium]|nr:hypothetical protein [Armatimonadota bacterium]
MVARLYMGVALASAATLVVQVALTRVFALVHWHHFAFVAVGLGLLGYGISGTALAVWPRLRRAPLETAAAAAVLVAPATGLALVAIATVPFDAYLMLLEPLQALYLAILVAALSLPFLCGGLVVGSLLTGRPAGAGGVYAASFVGAAAGALAAIPLISARGGAGALLVGGTIAACGGALLWWSARPTRASPVIAALAAAMLATWASAARFDLPLSAYKTLSQVRRYPDAQVVFSGWNAVSRVDVVRSSAVRSAPGLSTVYAGAPPALPGLLIDGEGLRGLPAEAEGAFTEYLPTAVAYRLRRGPTLIIGTGVEVLGALRHGAPTVTVIEENPLVADALRRVLEPGSQADVLSRHVRLLIAHPRTFLARNTQRFTIIQVPPLDSFQVVASGAFSLAEHYLYTVEAFTAYLRRLAPGGILVVTRWIQTPPSEEVRVWAAAVAAVEKVGDPDRRLAALRSLNTMTILVAPDGLRRADVETLRAFAISRHFDLTYAPGGSAAESNRFNTLPADRHREAFLAVLDTGRRDAFLREYPFDVRPVHDDRPFFFHFFRWRQVPGTLAVLGRTWQPFGGGGFLVLLVLLVIVTALGAGLILLPLGRLRTTPHPTQARAPGPEVAWRRWSVFAYFAALGFAYLFVEIPLLQQAILLVGSPTHAAGVVLSGLLLASGAGSVLTARAQVRLPAALAALATAVGGLAWALPALVARALDLTAASRLAAAAVILGPIGVLMGVPFPAAVRLLGQYDARLIPWAWGINGCASVVASVLAALVSLQWGFRTVLALAAIAYAGAGAVRGLGTGAGQRGPDPRSEAEA